MVLQPQRSAQPAPKAQAQAERKPASPTPKRVAERPAKPSTSRPVSEPDEGPPPPEDPPDWENDQPAEAATAVHDQVMDTPDIPEEKPLVPVQIDNQAPARAAGMRLPTTPSPAILTPKLPVGTVPARLDDDHPPQILTVILRPTGDAQRDIRRISRLHGTFISYPGKDRFAFQIFEEGRGHLIEFPNDTTHLCADLMARLMDAVGEENLRVEPIVYQSIS